MLAMHIMGKMVQRLIRIRTVRYLPNHIISVFIQTLANLTYPLTFSSRLHVHKMRFKIHIRTVLRDIQSCKGPYPYLAFD